MKIVLCHNFYQQPGGEDQVFADEGHLLEQHGHRVIRYTRHNDQVENMSKLAVAASTFWNRSAYRELRELFRQEKPDVVHCTNTFPLISPAVYYAARKSGVAVVQSLHNFRLFCAAAYLARDGQVCESCVGSLVPWAAVQHRCYRGSLAGSAVVGGFQVAHRMLGSWRHRVDRFIALTQFAAEKYRTAGFPAEKIAVKPNFVSPDPGPGMGSLGYALFVGRLSPEKGVSTLLQAWREHVTANIPLHIAGDGPLAAEVIAAAENDSRIVYHGRQNGPEVCRLMKSAALLIQPSTWYEMFPKTIVEAFSVGTPVLASRLGGMAEIVEDQKTGIHFTAGDAADLAEKVTQAYAAPEHLQAMRTWAREEYTSKYTAELNYQLLIDIYRQARLQAGLSVQDEPSSKHGVNSETRASDLTENPLAR